MAIQSVSVLKSYYETHTGIKLVVCSLGIYFFYFLYAVAQEHIALSRYGETEERYEDYFFILFVQCIINALVASVGLAFGSSGAKVPARNYIVIAISYVFAMYCSNAALSYVNYPTQVLAKSCKMVPVMLMGIIILRRRYNFIEYASVLLITAGIAMFQLTKPGTDQLQLRAGMGELLLLISLALDGVTGSLQERLFKNSEGENKQRPSTHQLMFYLNAWSLPVLLLVLFITGEGYHSVAFLTRAPALIIDICIFGVASALGQNFVFYTLRLFGALTLATVTTTRKFFSILFSVMWFGHSLHPAQWVGVCVVFAGLGLELVHKQMRSSAVKPAK
eukprot:TRINITY_DN8723_c0_g1_i1.p1 TRINITY_DN8723_c0_g1~~TRINITY_DN8723_c0_g1_i1.p1  ORF type:complete len:363 (-),score=51.00 TRINITY_DN8723_c0_g1_i1:51-1052(-)